MNRFKKLSEYQLSMIERHSTKEWIGQGWFVKTNIKNKYEKKKNITDVLDGVFRCYDYFNTNVCRERNRYIPITNDDIFNHIIDEISSSKNEKIVLKKEPLTKIRLFIPLKDKKTNDQIEEILEQFLISYVALVNERKRAYKNQNGLTYLDIETMKLYTSIYIKELEERSEAVLIISNIQNGKEIKITSRYDMRCALKEAYEKVIGEIDYYNPTNKKQGS